MLLDIISLEIWIKILECMDESNKFTIKDVLSLATCEKYLMNTLIKNNQKFYKFTTIPIKNIISPFYSYSIFIIR